MGFDNVVWGEADEMNSRKDSNYLPVLADLVAKQVLFATRGNDASTLEAFAAELLLLHNGHSKANQHVAVDMSAACTRGVSDNIGNFLVGYTIL